MYIEKNENGISVSAPEKNWRMIHNGTKVFYLKETEGYTNTKDLLFVAATKEECLAEATALNLTIPEELTK